MSEMSYPCGQPMPGYVFEALKYIGKVGVLTRPTWNNYLCPGTDQWKREQLQNMVRRKLLTQHSCQNLKGAWVLSSWVAVMLRQRGLSAVTPVPPHLIEHDEVVGRSAFILKQKGACKGWMSERELKMRGMDQFQVEKNKVSSKYPDAIFQMIIDGKQGYLALEFERTGKSSARYRTLMKNYSKLETLDLILYVTENDEIEKRIKSTLGIIRSSTFMKRIAFIKGRDWKIDPLSAPLLVDTKTTSLAKLIA